MPERSRASTDEAGRERARRRSLSRSDRCPLADESQWRLQSEGSKVSGRLISRETEKSRLPLKHAEGESKGVQSPERQRRERGVLGKPKPRRWLTTWRRKNRRGERGAGRLTPNRTQRCLARRKASKSRHRECGIRRPAKTRKRSSPKQGPVSVLGGNDKGERAGDEPAPLRGERSP
jgi:hypothetical protein